MKDTINVTRSAMPDYAEFCEEIRDLWDSHWLTNDGDKARRLAQALRAYLGVEHLALFTNGHLALEALLRAAGLRGEVITTPFTFASTTHAIVRCGLEPVFCDIREDDCTLDASKLEKLITERTCAIVPVHVYGRLCDDEAIGRVARKYHLPVFYDAAHAFGVTRNGVGAGAMGDAAMFSFHATKAYNTIEGGAIACRDAALCEKLELERNYGITSPEDVVSVGGNAKMNEFQAAMGLCNLRHVDEEIAARKRARDRYLQNLSGTPGLLLPATQPGVRDNCAYFPVVFDGFRKTRDEVFDALAGENIRARKYFYPLTSDYACYRGRAGFDSALTPVAARVAKNVLTLPMYGALTDDVIDAVCRVVLR